MLSLCLVIQRDMRVTSLGFCQFLPNGLVEEPLEDDVLEDDPRDEKEDEDELKDDEELCLRLSPSNLCLSVSPLLLSSSPRLLSSSPLHLSFAILCSSLQKKKHF